MRRNFVCQIAVFCRIHQIKTCASDGDCRSVMIQGAERALVCCSINPQRKAGDNDQTGVAQ